MFIYLIIKIMNLKLLKKQNYFHASFDTKWIEIIKRDGKEILKVSWYASTINKDRVWDVVLPSAFMSTISEYKQNPVILLQHKMDKPIWKATDLKIDETWLYIVAEISEDIDWCISAIKNGVLKWFSIWYKVEDWDEKFVNEEYVFEIKELELLEISIVSIPANPFTIIKSLDDCFIKEIAEQENKEEIIEEVKEEEKQEEVIPEVTPEIVPEPIIEDPKPTEASEEIEKAVEITASETTDDSQVEEKGLKDFSFKIFEKRLKETSSDLKKSLEVALFDKIDKALWDKSENIKSELVETVKNTFAEYTKSQENLLTVMVDSLKNFDAELIEMFALVKALRNSKWYNFEKPIEVKEAKGDALTKALKMAKQI